MIEVGLVNSGGSLVAPTSDANIDVGLIMHYYSGSAKKAAVYWDDSVARVVVGSDVSESSQLPQLTAYKILWDSLYGEEHGKIDKLACLHLADTWRKKPTYKLKEYDFDPEAWYNTLDLFKWLHPVQPKFVDELPTIYELKKEKKTDVR